MDRPALDLAVAHSVAISAIASGRAALRSAAYLRPTDSLTGKFRRLTVLGLGDWLTTRPTSERLERTRRILPTEQ